MRDLTPAEVSIVSGGEFSLGGLQASVAAGFVAGAVFGGATFGFYFGPMAFGGALGGLAGGAAYAWDELIG
jgi:hypothetical protein